MPVVLHLSHLLWTLLCTYAFDTVLNSNFARMLKDQGATCFRCSVSSCIDGEQATLHCICALKKLNSGANTRAMYHPHTKFQNSPMKKLGQVIQVKPGMI